MLLRICAEGVKVFVEIEEKCIRLSDVCTDFHLTYVCTTVYCTHVCTPCFALQLNAPSSLPAAAKIDLPPIHMHAEYRAATVSSCTKDLGDGLNLRIGEYLEAMAEVGQFQHCLTTDLLNHLVFMQKVFMKVSHV